MVDMNLDVPEDQLLLDTDDLAAPVEVTFNASWERVEQALAAADIVHDPVRYRLKQDSSGVLALFIEVPVADGTAPDRLLHAEELLRDALRELDGPRPFYVHFLDSATKAEQVA